MVWEEITEMCRVGSTQLNDHSSMISTNSFSLLQSMSAVELMDPKMDQCFQMSPSTINTDNLMNVVVPEQFTFCMATKILKILIVYEASLIDGASALESTHQCKLLWDGSWAKFPTQNLAQRAVLAYCKSLNLSLNRLCHGVSEADIFEGLSSYHCFNNLFPTFSLNLVFFPIIFLSLSPTAQMRIFNH